MLKIISKTTGRTKYVWLDDEDEPVLVKDKVKENKVKEEEEKEEVKEEEEK